jgi:hypothetical protein
MRSCPSKNTIEGFQGTPLQVTSAASSRKQQVSSSGWANQYVTLTGGQSLKRYVAEHRGVRNLQEDGSAP